jgi:threonine/homoserine/homoserine lactone efflux protein
MSVGGAGVGAAFALGFALGAAPGPVQLLILSETAKRGREGCA